MYIQCKAANVDLIKPLTKGFPNGSVFPRCLSISFQLYIFCKWFFEILLIQTWNFALQDQKWKFADFFFFCRKAMSSKCRALGWKLTRQGALTWHSPPLFQRRSSPSNFGVLITISLLAEFSFWRVYTGGAQECLITLAVSLSSFSCLWLYHATQVLKIIIWNYILLYNTGRRGWVLKSKQQFAII